MTKIIHAGGVIEPIAVSDYRSSRDGGSIVHAVLGRSNPDITTRPAGLRTGTLNLTFADESASLDAENAHVSGGVFSVLSDERPTVEMYYIVPQGGGIDRTLGPAGDWTLNIAYQEIDPE